MSNLKLVNQFTEILLNDKTKLMTILVNKT